MENILSQFNADNLEIKLTSEKLFINTITSNETFALRSVSGVGVIDLVDDYNQALTIWKKKSDSLVALFIFGGLCLIAGIASGKEGSPGISLGTAMIAYGFYLLNQSIKKPSLMSAVRIMMSGGNRDFQFDKTGIKSGNIAEFVANVESTLTSYHKNNG